MKSIFNKGILLAAISCFALNISYGQGMFNSGKHTMLQPSQESSQVQVKERIPWQKSDLKDPNQLATQMKNGKTGNTLILNIGSVNDIKSAVNIGPVAIPGNLEKLKHYLVNVPKHKSIIIYCGCCPVNVCPNIKPAYDLLEQEGFTNFKVLNLENNLNMDWISKDYPMKGKK